MDELSFISASFLNLEHNTEGQSAAIKSIVSI